MNSRLASIQELAQERASIEAILEHPARMDKAMEEIQSEQGLRALLENEELAPMLAAINKNLEGCGYELMKLKREYRVPENAVVALECVMRAAAQMERVLFKKAIGG